MAKLTKKTFIESIKEMNIKEVIELVDAMKEEFGIDPTAVVVSDSSQESEEVKTEFKVTLKSFGGNKVSVIKLIKEILGVGLMDAKKLVESAPATIKENVKTEEANEIKQKLVEAGAEVELA